MKRRASLVVLSLLMISSLVLSGWTSPAQAASPAEELVQEAQKLVGQPFRYGGESLQEGFDSSGLVYFLYGRQGVELPRTVKDQAYSDLGKIVKKSQLAPGDLVFFGTSVSNPTVVGVYIGDGKVVASRTGGVKVYSLSSSLAANSYLGAKRIFGVVDATPEVPTPTPTPQPVPSPQPQPELQQPEQNLADSIIATGMKYLGTRYKFGAPSGTTSAFDCSSFTQYIFGVNGVKLPRSSRSQSSEGEDVSYGQWQKGDLLFFSSSATGPNTVGHVAVYMGDGKILHTYRVGIGVTVENLQPWLKTYLGAKRVL